MNVHVNFRMTSQVLKLTDAWVLGCLQEQDDRQGDAINERTIPMTTELIAAVDSLRLPTAQLTKEEWAGINEMVTKINEAIHKNMRRAGMNISFPVPNINPNISGEVTRIFEAKGWMVRWEPQWKQPHIRGGNPWVEAVVLYLQPNKAAYDAVPAEEVKTLTLM